MAISFDFSDNNNHINDLMSQIKKIIDIDYDAVTVDNLPAFRASAKAISEPDSSKVINLLNYIVFNNQLHEVYGEN